MHFTDAKAILSAKNGMNIYRGCTHGCIYCDSRSTCYQMKHEFEDIEVKQNAHHEKLIKLLHSECKTRSVMYNADEIFGYLNAFPKQEHAQLSLF